MEKEIKRQKPTGKAMNPMTDAERSQNFIEAAREHECDESGADFEKVFTRAVPQLTGKPAKKDKK